jgi:hypothetical protein
MDDVYFNYCCWLYNAKYPRNVQFASMFFCSRLSIYLAKEYVYVRVNCGLYVRILAVFFYTGKNRVVKIVRFSSEIVLWIINHTMIYPNSAPFSRSIALCPIIWYWRWTYVTMRWAESSMSSYGEGENDLVLPVWMVGGLLETVATVE